MQVSLDAKLTVLVTFIIAVPKDVELFPLRGHHKMNDPAAELR